MAIHLKAEVKITLAKGDNGKGAVAYAYSRAQGRSDIFADDPQCWIAATQ